MNSIEEESAAQLTWSAAEDTGASPVATMERPAPDDDADEERGPAFLANAANIASAGRLGSWHLPRGQTTADLCATLNRRGVNYVLLPPAVGADEKRNALLVADEDSAKVRELITRTPIGQPLAVYTATGLPGFSFQQHWRNISDATSMAVLPAYLAEAMLASAIADAQGRRVLPKKELLLWEIYRGLFLNGDVNFARHPIEDAPILVGAQARIISDLAGETGAELAEPLKLATLHQHLSESGWAPPLDVLRRICCLNSWAAWKVQEWEAEQSPEEPGMTVFFVRRAVFDEGMESGIAALIDTGGFEVLKTIDLDEQQIESTAKTLRGGNWGPGAFAVNGGPPVRIYIAFDVEPAEVTPAMREKYPQLDNAHILEAKLRCREYIDDRLPAKRRFNPVHSTDDSAHAWEVVRMFAADEEPAFRELIARRKAAFETKFPLAKTLTRTGLRAKIELIHYRGGLAVKKTFRENCLRFMEREASFMDAVSPHRREIPPVLERGPNYLIMPFIDGRPLRRFILGRGFPELMTMKQLRGVADLLRDLFARGYDPIDLAPHNLLVDHQSGELRAIDFEFVHWNGGPVDPDQAACLHGIPDDFKGEWPPKALWCPQRAKCVDPWRFRWFACTGLSLHSFLHDPPALQRVKRFVNYPVHLGTRTLQIQQEWLRHRVARTLKRRLPVLTRLVRSALRTRRASAPERA